MAFKERGKTDAVNITAASVWDLDEWYSVGTSLNPYRIKNISIQGVYSIDQATEANSQYGTIIAALMRFPDTVSTPDPDIVESGVGGVDRQIFKWRFVHGHGQNNPVLWSMRFKAVNVNPGQKLLFGLRVKQESGVSLNHRIQVASRWWIDEG